MVASFRAEAEDLLAGIEETALNLDGRHDRTEGINELFRAFHTIKGSGAMFGFDAVAQFTHHVETVLDAARDGTLAVTPQLLDQLLAARDHIKSLLNKSEDNSSQASQTAVGLAIISALNSLRQDVGHDQIVPASSVPLATDATVKSRSWKIKFRPDPLIMATGGDPIPVVRELCGLGPYSLKLNAEGIPELESIDCERCYFEWIIELQTEASENDIKDVVHLCRRWQ